MPYQPNIHHTLKHTYRSTLSNNHHPFKRISLSPSSSSLLTHQTTDHLPYHIPSRLTHRTHTDTTPQPASALAPQASHTHHQHKPTLMHHAKDNNQITKTTLTNTTQPPQHPSHNTRHKHNQNPYTLQHKHNQTNTSTNNRDTISHPMPLLFQNEINPAIMELLLQSIKTLLTALSNAPLTLFIVHHIYTVHQMYQDKAPHVATLTQILFMFLIYYIL